jgi:nucleoside-diphosphate-sugar epimerase
MRVLVTGHHGYIGAVLVRTLTAAGYEVVGLDSDFFVQNRFLGEVVEARSLIKDLRDIELEDLRGINAVLHLAALSNDPLGDLNAHLTYEINYHGSMRLARLAKQAGVARFLFSSSCSMYGAAGSEMLTEEAPFNPVTPYADSKVLVERDLRSLADARFSPVFLRNTTAYGVSPFMRFDVVLNNLVAWAFATGRVLIQSDGTPWRPLVHIEDICRAFLAALEAPTAVVHNQAFNVGTTEENYQVRDLAAIVRETVPGCHIEYSPGGGPDTRSYRVDFSKLKSQLPGFAPQWNVRRGAQEMFQACRDVNLRVEDFEGPRFKRIAQIREHWATGRLDAQLRWSSTPSPSTASAAVVS